MGLFQNILSSVLPADWRASMEHESRCWAMVCPNCGKATSVWRMGGVRWKASGTPSKRGACAHCGQVFFGKLERRATPVDRESSPYDSTLMASGDTDSEIESNFSTQRERPYPSASHAGTLGNFARLWIDGVGCWGVCLEPQFSICGPSSQPEHGIKFLGELARQHVTIVRNGESYRLDPHAEFRVNGRMHNASVALRHGDRIACGDACEVRFRQPSPLSASAALDLQASETVGQRLEGLIMLEHVCLIGPAVDSHIVCPRWDDGIVLFQRDSQIWCQKNEHLLVNGEPLTHDQLLESGDVIVNGTAQIRVELG